MVSTSKFSTVGCLRPIFQTIFCLINSSNFLKKCKDLLAHLGLVPCRRALAASADVLPLAMDVGGLGAKWEAENGIRDRIRKDRKLCLHPLSQRYCEPTRPNAISNAMVLRPALQILRDTKGWKLPHIEPLQAEIFQLFQRVGTPVEDQYVYTSSMEVKKLLGFVKRRCTRREVTKACDRFQTRVFFCARKLEEFATSINICLFLKLHFQDWFPSIPQDK